MNKAVWTPQLEEEMIELIKPHREIWDHNDALYRKINLKKRRFQEITDTLHKRRPYLAKILNADSVSKKFGLMRSYYAKQLRNEQRKGIHLKNPWKHFERLSFLRDDIDEESLKQESVRPQNAPMIIRVPSATSESLMNLMNQDEHCIEEEHETEMNLKPASLADLSELLNSERSKTQNSVRVDDIDEAFGQFVAPMIIRVPSATSENLMDLMNQDEHCIEEEHETEMNLKPASLADLSELLNSERSKTQNSVRVDDIDEALGQFIVSILKSIPESKKKDNNRLKIIQELLSCKHS